MGRIFDNAVAESAIFRHDYIDTMAADALVPLESPGQRSTCRIGSFFSFTRSFKC